MENPSELLLKHDDKRDLAFRPQENAWGVRTVDAISTQSKPFQHLQEATNKKAIEEHQEQVRTLLQHNGPASERLGHSRRFRDFGCESAFPPKSRHRRPRRKSAIIGSDVVHSIPSSAVAMKGAGKFNLTPV